MKYKKPNFFAKKLGFIFDKIKRLCYNGKMENLKNVTIGQEFISLFASGFSILDIDLDTLLDIKSKSFVITTNYPLSLKEPSFSSHLHVWGDVKPTRFLIDYYKDREKDCLWASREQAFNEELKQSFLYKNLDFIFNDKEQKLIGKFTLFWVLDILRRKYRNKKFLIFGMDGFIPDDTKMIDGVVSSKWYDYYTKADFKNRTYQRDKSSLEFFNNFIQDIKDNKLNLYGKDFFNNIYNCNLNSRVKHISKMYYRDVFR